MTRARRPAWNLLPVWPLTLCYFFLMAVWFYGTWIEPFRIEITRHSRAAGLAADLKIAHVTDLHTRGLRLRERRLIEKLEVEKPDVILITGDSIIDASDYQKVHEVLVQFHAPLGVWAIRGNWENALRVDDGRLWEQAQNEEEFYRGSGVRLLLNEAARLRDDVWLVGIDEPTHGSPDVERAFASVPKDVYRIALFHCPSTIAQVAGRAQLALSGHTHGGQVRLPFFPPLYLPEGSGNYVAGWYSEGGTDMYVSRGIGNSIAEIRILSSPELPMIELKKR